MVTVLVMSFYLGSHKLPVDIYSILHFTFSSRDYVHTGLLSTERSSKTFCVAEDRNIKEKQTKKPNKQVVSDLDIGLPLHSARTGNFTKIQISAECF